MSIQKIFITLVTVIVCLIIGAFILNTFMPNAIVQLSNSLENAIYSGTGMKFDFNGDGVSGTNGGADATNGGNKTIKDTTGGVGGSNVEGYSGFKGESGDS